MLLYNHLNLTFRSLVFGHTNSSSETIDQPINNPSYKKLEDRIKNPEKYEGAAPMPDIQKLTKREFAFALCNLLDVRIV